jgi:pantoate--beta-alanine ligase
MSTASISTTIPDVQVAVSQARKQGLTIGLVPTMGALHAGHASLIRAARAETGFVVVSIFVNPTQFGPNEDLQRYPRTLEADRVICSEEAADLIFLPAAEEIYPATFHTFVEVIGMQDGLCGAARPGHFRGVATVVLKLFNIVRPDVAYFGQKDAQQARIIEQMVSDLNVPIQIRTCPIIREADGLALSSRNCYLDEHQRRHAPVLYQALKEAENAIALGQRQAQAIQQGLIQRVSQTPGALLDYAAIVDADTLQPVSTIRGKVLVALAVKFGETRLIDNVVVKDVF